MSDLDTFEKIQTLNTFEQLQGTGFGHLHGKGSCGCRPPETCRGYIVTVDIETYDHGDRLAYEVSSWRPTNENRKRGWYELDEDWVDVFIPYEDVVKAGVKEDGLADWIGDKFEGYLPTIWEKPAHLEASPPPVV